ncbi:imidazole glycerol phosphate synthase subunit HisH [Candidatus Woesearchaeota archaeon CG11_big_fil_rev_8_21_14_0_20_43_8]|nr:MAG: imidazole glycerol phosphate synthase subunit HisH [Candidatus Woesearchaeota archaeon CG11_big_fil_rev_8_21_14_0_20_43_8]PIO08825.1 MAG: imidazole glycerol phosphate synthase subunit HisH [Candidatus Woesearchaeota archaeon CG08_land_8_20_14_0_20_43_7]
MIIIVDYGMGNLRSVHHKVSKLGVGVKVSSDPKDILEADKLILPGVGSFAAGMKNLKELGLIEALEKRVLEDKIPILGICLGMQLFTNMSEEGNVKGLAWIDAKTIRFTCDLKVPHVGWNDLRISRKSTLFKGVPKGTHFYFTHSYHVVCNDKKDVLATTEYGYDFSSALQKENIYGTQFHPEKSHKKGMRIMENFIKC